ncbi:MAG TPA: hypothetical protein VFO41_09430 [Alphaproteobacteria bacterium]|nr:hypothetical protein [Alphaproteobacteria bacterium]
MTMSSKDAPLPAYLTGAMGLCVSCAVLPMAFGIAGANPDLTRTQVAFWVCVLVIAALCTFVGHLRWHRWLRQQS